MGLPNSKSSNYTVGSLHVGRSGVASKTVCFIFLFERVQILPRRKRWHGILESVITVRDSLARLPVAMATAIGTILLKPDVL